MKVRQRLIIADDYKLLVEVYRDLLEQEFDVVAVAYDGQQLVSEALAHSPDAIIVDINMPDMSGFDAAEQVLQQLPSVKLIFLTADPSPSLRDLALQKGATAVVVKGDASDLIAALRCSFTNSVKGNAA